MSASHQSPFIPPLLRLFRLHTIDPTLPTRLRDLANDIEMLFTQSAPDDAVLREAPVLDQWVPAFLPTGISLIGHVSGHPELRGPVSITSPIRIIAVDLTWVRTASRFYSLGTMKILDGQSDEVSNVH